MALTIPTFGSVPVDIRPGNASRKYIEVGGRRRAWTGDMHQTVRDTRSQWRFRTKLIPAASAAALISALEGAQPLACSGDALGGAVNCFYEAVGDDMETMASGPFRVVEFILHEA